MTLTFRAFSQGRSGSQPVCLCWEGRRLQAATPSWPAPIPGQASVHLKEGLASLCPPSRILVCPSLSNGRALGTHERERTQSCLTPDFGENACQWCGVCGMSAIALLWPLLATANPWEDEGESHTRPGICTFCGLYPTAVI